jgi:hypothetical protein
MTTSASAGGATCVNPASRKNNPQCSDAYGAAMFSVEELK